MGMRNVFRRFTRALAWLVALCICAGAGGEAWMHAAAEGMYEDYYGYGMGRNLGWMYVVNCEEWVSLREHPDTGSRRLAKIPLGTRLEVYQVNEEFGECVYQEYTGYVLLSYLSSREPVAESASPSDFTDGELFEMWNAWVDGSRRVDMGLPLGGSVDPRVDSVDGVDIGQHAHWFMTTVGEFTTEGILRGMADLYGAYGYMDAHGDVPFLASRLDEAGASLELLQSDLYSWEYVDGGDWTYDSPFSTTYEFYLFKLMAPEHDYTFLVYMYSMSDNGEAYDLEIVGWESAGVM